MEKKRWRARPHKGFSFINILGEVQFGKDCCTRIDDALYNYGNYFQTKEEAEAMASKLRAVLAGADVVQMPSGAEILDAAEGHIEACDEEGHPYSDKYDAKAAFVNGAEWLKSKIIK